MSQPVVTSEGIEVTRVIRFTPGGRHRIVGSQGFDFGNGIIEVIEAMELPSNECVASEDYNQLWLTDPTVAFVPWVKFRYMHERDWRHYGDQPIYMPADLLADHIACQ